jgi:hypothetical protein
MRVISELRCCRDRWKRLREWVEQKRLALPKKYDGSMEFGYWDASMDRLCAVLDQMDRLEAEEGKK